MNLTNLKEYLKFCIKQTREELEKMSDKVYKKISKKKKEKEDICPKCGGKLIPLKLSPNQAKTVIKKFGFKRK